MRSSLTYLSVLCPYGEMQLSAARIMQAAKVALKHAAGALAEALAERDAAGEERAGIEAQLQAALKLVAGGETFSLLAAFKQRGSPAASLAVWQLCP